MSTSLLVSTHAVSCYPAVMVNLIWFADENVYRVSTEQHGDMKSCILRSKNSTILQARCPSALSCSNMWKTNYPHRLVNAITLHVFVVATVTLQIFVTKKPDFSPSVQGINWQHQLRLASLYPWCI